MICLIPPTSEEDSSTSVLIYLFVFNVSDNMDTHLLSNKVFTISSLLMVHLLRFFITTAVLSGDDDER